MKFSRLLDEYVREYMSAIETVDRKTDEIASSVIFKISKGREGWNTLFQIEREWLSKMLGHQMLELCDLRLGSSYPELEKCRDWLPIHERELRGEAA